jgi:hypothetical protein
MLKLFCFNIPDQTEIIKFSLKIVVFSPMNKQILPLLLLTILALSGIYYKTYNHKS